MRERGRDVGPIAGLRSKETCRCIQNTTTTLWLSTKKTPPPNIVYLISCLQCDRQNNNTQTPYYAVVFFHYIMHLNLYSTKQARIYNTLLPTRFPVYLNMNSRNDRHHALADYLATTFFGNDLIGLRCCKLALQTIAGKTPGDRGSIV